MLTREDQQEIDDCNFLDRGNKCNYYAYTFELNSPKLSIDHCGHCFTAALARSMEEFSLIPKAFPVLVPAEKRKINAFSTKVKGTLSFDDFNVECESVTDIFSICLMMKVNFKHKLEVKSFLFSQVDFLKEGSLGLEERLFVDFYNMFKQWKLGVQK